MGTAAIVILNYNGRGYLRKFLPVLLKNTPGHPVYVADNLSQDDSLNLVRKNFPEVHIIELDRNYGFSEGYNRALSRIDAPYYVLLNSDVEVTENWLEPLILLMEKDPDIAACQPKILDYNRREYFEYAGAAGGFIDRFGYPFCRGRIFQIIEKDFGQYDDISPVFWASGACMMIRSRDFHEMKGFDVDYFAHMEEIDLCWRLKLAGKKIYYNGKSRVYHVGGGTLSHVSPLKTYLNFRNSFVTLIKNSSKGSVYIKILIRFLLDLVAAFKFLLFDSWENFKAVIKADAAIIRNFNKISGKRAEIKRINDQPGEMYRRSIVFDHYFLQKRYFFNLRSIIPDRIMSSAQPFPEIHGKSQRKVYDNR